MANEATKAVGNEVFGILNDADELSPRHPHRPPTCETETCLSMPPTHYPPPIRSALDPSPSIAKSSSGGSRPLSRISHISHRSQPSNPDSAAETLSHHGSDLFSEHSPRSSIGSSSSSNPGREHLSFHSSKTPAQYATAAYNPAEEDDTSTRKSSRNPCISNISAYEEDFIPSSARRESRATFAPNGDFKYMPSVSSPEQSVFNGSTPRGSLRRKLGSSASPQYSPKNRSTPSRLKVKTRATARPLVLLHVTLLPLRWQWSDLINTADVADMSEECKNIRDNWRLLQDNVGDTMLERGILLPHPQDDYGVLEERLLDALQLPGKRRVRILECGHYAGNTLVKAGDEEFSDEEEEDEKDADCSESATGKEKRRWCHTCRCDIRYDSHGCANIFRIKVYASNGLISAGAWEACWKEMERVDMELEPVVDAAIQDELEHLADLRDERQQALIFEAEEQASYLHRAVAEAENEMVKEHIMNEPLAQHPSFLSSPVPPMSSPGLTPSPTPDTRRRLDEERLREIYGRTPPASAQEHISHLDSPTLSPCPIPRSTIDPASSQTHANAKTAPLERHPDSYIPMSSPPSPTTQAFERRELRQAAQQQKQQEQQRKVAVPQDASLAELLLQAGRVAINDKRNLAIIFLSILVLVFALRSPGTAALSDNGLQGKTITKTNSGVVDMEYSEVPIATVKQEKTSDPECMNVQVTVESVEELAMVESPKSDDIAIPVIERGVECMDTVDGDDGSAVELGLEPRAAVDSGIENHGSWSLGIEVVAEPRNELTLEGKPEMSNGIEQYANNGQAPNVEAKQLAIDSPDGTTDAAFVQESGLELVGFAESDAVSQPQVRGIDPK